MSAPAPITASVFGNKPEFDPERHRIADSAQRKAVLDTLDEQWRRWRQRRPRSYEYRVEEECFCFGGFFRMYAPYIVQVARGQTAVFDSTAKLVTSDSATAEELTIDAIFEELRQNIAEGADYAHLIYDPEFGFPTFGRTDHVGYTDSSFEVTIAGFRHAAGYPAKSTRRL